MKKEIINKIKCKLGFHSPSPIGQAPYLHDLSKVIIGMGCKFCGKKLSKGYLVDKKKLEKTWENLLNIKLYYTAPTDEQFNELKEKAIEVWRTYDDTYSYASEKIAGIKDLKNIQDNFMFIVAMFDIQNQIKLAEKLSEETRTAVRERMIDGGNPPEYIKF